jgi:hypothetical protein
MAKAKEKKLFLMEGMWTRFFPVARAIKQAIALTLTLSLPLSRPSPAAPSARW